MSFVTSVAVILVTFLLALALTGSVRRVLVRRALLDIPNDRSSHSMPVPRGGGWALVMILLPCMGAAGVFIDHDLRHVGLIAAVMLLAVISWLDDRKGVSARLRLSFHILAACLGSFAFAPQETLFGGAIPFWCDRAVMIIGWAWFINLYNFMDGIDGITGVETVSIATGLCLVATAAGIDNAYVDVLTLALTGVCLGFLAYNWHPAKLFLGDVGSVPLGYLAGFCLLSLAVAGHPVAACILPLYYLADSGITIIARALRREKIWQAHRQHFYQRAALGAGRHDIVVIWIIVANIGLICAALLSLTHPTAGLACAIGVVAVLLGKMHKTGMKTAKNP